MTTATHPSSIKNLSRLPVLLHLLLTVFCAAPLPGQQPFHIEPVFRNYTTDDGLPSNETFAILQDREGYMWFSTNLGVCRFDGYRFEQFPDTLQANFTAVLTRCLKEDECGRIWWADMLGRLFYLENDRIRPWKYNPVLDSLRTAGAYRAICGLLVEACGDEIWLAAYNLGTLHFDRHGRWEKVPGPQEYGHFGILLDRQSGFLANYLGNYNPIGESLPLMLFKDGRSSDPLPGDQSNFVFFMGKFSKGHYLASISKNIYLFQDMKLQWWRKYDQDVVWVFEDDDGSLLVGQQRGGGVRQYDSLEDMREGKVAASFLEGLSISVIFKDREGGYWFGSQEQGLFYCASLNAGVVQGLPDLDGDIGKAVITGMGNELYYGTQNGRIFILNPSENTWQDISPDFVDYLYTFYFDENKHTLLVAGLGTATRRAGKWSGIIDGLGFLSRLSAADIDNNLWYGVHSGSLFFLDISKTGKKWIGTQKALQKDWRNFYSVGVDGFGRVWTSSSVGFQQFFDGRFRSPEIQHPAFLQPSKDIQLLNDSTLVFCPRSYGLAFWNPDHKAPPEIIGEAQGLVFNKVDRLFLEPDGAVWACTEHGASRIAADRRRIDNYTVKNGLPSNQVSQVAEAGGWYWLATGKGLARIEREPVVTLMPAPKLVRVAVDGNPYNIHSALELPYDSASIAIRWVALHFRSNGQIRYRYRLISDGHTPAWSTTEDLQVNYSNLSPGKYRFEVQALGAKGRWSDTTALAMLIRPPWYATWWARGAALALLTVLGWGLYRYRIGAIRKESELREEMLRLERSALQAQMNPHFIFNCLNSIQHFILENDADSAVLYLARFAKLVRSNLQVSAAGSVSLEEEVQMLDNYLALERLRFRQVFDYTIEVDEGLNRLDTRLPPLIVQPFVENAVLHGMKGKEKDGRIRVTFRQDNGYLQVEVLDNGPGIQERNAAKDKPSLGRSITQRRLELLRQQTDRGAITADYQQPENGGGTRILIRLPLE